MRKLLIKLFIKDYENVKDAQVRENYGKLAGIVGIISNSFLCIIKIFSGLLVNSIAIIADGINNLADASSSIITLVGFKLAAAPEDEEHPYGHARIEYLTGLFISILIIILGVKLLTTSFDKILNPDPLQFRYITLVILIVSICVKIWQALFNIKIGETIHSSALKATGMDSRNDVIATSAVLISVLFGKFTGIQLDGYMGCLVALFIVYSGIQLIRETSSPLLGEAPDPLLIKEIQEKIEAYEGVYGLHDLVVHDYGPGRIFASVHIEVDAHGDLIASHDLIDNIERAVCQELRLHLVAHMDPVDTKDPLTLELKKKINEFISPIDGILSLHDLRIVVGYTHTNIIFDLVLSPDCKLSHAQIRQSIEASLQEFNPNYFVVITFDMSFSKEIKS